MMGSLKNIVVVGASYLGQRAATTLAKRAELSATHRIIVIEPNSHFSHLFIFPRISIVSGYEHKAFIPFTNMFHDAKCESRILRAAVSKVDKDRVVLDRDVDGFGREVSYDYLVYAAGSRLTPPGNIPSDNKKDGIEYFQSMQKEVRKANRVVVIGGGAVGLQIATDLKTSLPDKEVHLVHSRSQLLNKFHPDLHKAALASCEEYGITTHLGVRAVIPDGGYPVGTNTPFTVTLNNGTSLPDIDLVLQCTGQTFNSTPISSLIGPNLNPDGTIHVTPALQVPSHPNIFAIGDINDVLRIKTVRMAIPQVDVATENIINLVQGKEPEAVVPPSGAGIHLTLGLFRDAYCRMETQLEGAAGGAKVEDVPGGDRARVKVEKLWDSLGADKSDFFA
ncbi:hypothetical protein HDV00_003660 [Rhizophlyctis rosea]|nr:hypothetical protein HDV00_003660 [Rhizophlyctis rosea]